MSATAIQSDTLQLVVLGRYAVPEEGRVLVGRRIEGEVYVYDYPSTAGSSLLRRARLRVKGRAGCPDRGLPP